MEPDVNAFESGLKPFEHFITLKSLKSLESLKFFVKSLKS